MNNTENSKLEWDAPALAVLNTADTKNGWYTVDNEFAYGASLTTYFYSS